MRYADKIDEIEGIIEVRNGYVDGGYLGTFFTYEELPLKDGESVLIDEECMRIIVTKKL